MADMKRASLPSVKSAEMGMSAGSTYRLNNTLPMRSVAGERNPAALRSRSTASSLFLASLSLPTPKTKVLPRRRLPGSA